MTCDPRPAALPRHRLKAMISDLSPQRQGTGQKPAETGLRKTELTMWQVSTPLFLNTGSRLQAEHHFTVEFACARITQAGTKTQTLQC